MQIYFTGNTTPVKSFNIGIKGNNAADTIEFILDAQQGNVDLSACTAYVKSASPITSFADKQRVEIQSADEGKIKVSWSMLRKHTLNHSLNVQLQFEDYDRDICWQTVSLQNGGCRHGDRKSKPLDYTRPLQTGGRVGIERKSYSIFRFSRRVPHYRKRGRSLCRYCGRSRLSVG